MTELDLAITAALRADAQEAEMATDTARENEKLQTRLDEVEQTHRRRTVAWAAVAAAAAVIVVVAGGFLLAGRGDTQQHVTAPVPGTAHSDPYFSPSFTMNLPDWAVSHHVTPFENSVYSWWTTPTCLATSCTDLSVSRYDGLLVGGQGPTLTYDAYLQHLGDLATQGTITINSSIPRTVDGRRATEIDATSTKGAPLVLGCAGADCQDVQPNMKMRYVVVDMGAGQNPIVIFMETAKGNPHAGAWLAQLDTVLTSIRFASR